MVRFKKGNSNDDITRDQLKQIYNVQADAPPENIVAMLDAM